MDAAPLTDAQIERYSRQIILPQVGGRGQQRLLASTVSLIGQGPLAETAAAYLAAAGVGTLEIWGTANRPLSNSPPPGGGDTGSLQVAPSALNPEIAIRERSFDAFAPAASVVFVCADVSLAVLLAINQAALRSSVPLIAGGQGALATYAGHHQTAPCAACDGQPPIVADETRAEPSSGLVGSLLAVEAIKVCLGLPGAGSGRSLHFDPETLTITECPISKRAGCGACAPGVGTDA